MTYTGPKVWREEGTTWFEHVCNNERVIKYSLPEVIWTVLSIAPLTLRAVVNCAWCGLQGRMDKGEWVPIGQHMQPTHARRDHS